MKFSWFTVILLLCGAIFQTCIGQGQIHTLLGEMSRLISEPTADTHKGHPFSRIAGPKSKFANIAVVGAGPSGLHIAYELYKRGYQRITIFEANDYVGGKSHTEESAGGQVKHDLGTCYTNGDYTSLFDLIKELNVSVNTVPVPMSTINYYGVPPMSYQTFLMSYLNRVWPTKNPQEALVAFFQTMLRYMQKHQELFGRFSGEIMPQPSAEIMERELRKTFDQFLVDNDMISLRPMFTTAHTIMGYGQLDEVSAIYGLMWMTPRFVYELAPETVDNKIYMFVEGFQSIWEHVDRYLNRRGINIHKGTPVRKIKVMPDGKFKFNCGTKHYGGKQDSRQVFDFLIWTPSIQLANLVIWKFWEQFPSLHLASRVQESQYLTTTLVSVQNDTWSNVNYWFSNIEGDRSQDSVWADRYTAAVKGVSLGSHSVDRTLVTYIFGPTRPREEDIVYNLNQFYTKYNPALKSEPHIWPYFQHFNVEDMSTGLLWKLIEEQGSNNAWFIGSSVSLESVKSVMEYNNLLLRNFL